MSQISRPDLGRDKKISNFFAPSIVLTFPAGTPPQVSIFLSPFSVTNFFARSIEVRDFPRRGGRKICAKIQSQIHRAMARRASARVVRRLVEDELQEGYRIDLVRFTPLDN